MCRSTPTRKVPKTRLTAALQRLGPGLACLAICLLLSCSRYHSSLVANLGFILLVKDVSADHHMDQRLAIGVESEDLFRFAIKYYPNNYMAWRGLGWALELQGKQDEAGAAWRNVPGIGAAFASRAEDMHTRGQVGSAALWYERALAVNPYDTVASAQLGRLLLERGEFAAAADLLATAVASVPSNPLAQAHLCYALRGSGQYQEALARYQLAPAAVQNYVSLHACVGKVYWDLGRYAEAYDHLAAAVELQPQEASHHFWLSLVLNRLGWLGDSIREAERAWELAPNRTDYACHLANLYSSDGLYARARDLLLRILADAPDCSCAVDALSRLNASQDW